MKSFIAGLRGTAPYGQGKHHQEPRLPRELDKDYELRTWLAKAHIDHGEVIIPPMPFKKLLESIAGYMKDKIPGKGQETYTKHIRQGLVCPEPVRLGVAPEKFRQHQEFLPSQPGKVNSGRVWKSFPVLDQWEGELLMHAIDDILSAEIIHKYLKLGGQLVGIGVWRPERGGMWGKFSVTDFRELEELPEE